MNNDRMAILLAEYLAKSEGLDFDYNLESSHSPHQTLLEDRAILLSELTRFPRHLSNLDDDLFLYFEENYSKGSFSVLLALLAVGDFHKMKLCKDMGVDFTQKDYYLLRMATHSQDLKSVKFVDRECGNFFSRFGIDMEKVQDVSKLKVARGMLTCSNFLELCEFITGRKTPFIQKKIYSYIFKDGESSPNTEVLDYLKVASETITTMQDPSRLVNLAGPESPYVTLEDPRPKLVQILNELYSETILVRLLGDDSDPDIIDHTIRDLNRLFQRINTSTDEDPSQKLQDPKLLKKALGKKPKSIREIHDNLTQLMSKLGQPFYTLKRTFVAPLDGKRVGKYRLVTPKTSYELVDLGSSLGGICVGNGHYSESDIKDKTNIVSVYEEEKVVACIEVGRDGSILESKTFYNAQWKDEKVYSYIKENVRCQV